MLKIFRYLKDNIISVILIILLLVVQANCDLTIPGYTSNIINVGVQQGGISETNPKVIRESKLNEILLFVDQDTKEEILANYNLVTEKSSQYDYDILDEEPVYVIKDENKLNSDLEKAILIDFMLTSDEEEAKNIQNEIKKDMPLEMQDAAIIDVIAFLPIEQLEEMRANINEQFSSMPDSIISQSAVSAIKLEYIEVGLDTDSIQTNYIIITGLKMLGLSLLSVTATILTVLLGARVGSGLSKRVRKKEFTKVLNFGTAEYKQFGISSLITRSTNDIQQVQMMIIMTLRLFIYAPIIAFGAVRKVFATAPSMTYIIWLGIIVVLVVIFTLFALTMPKFKKVQKLIDKLNQVTREIITGIPVIRAFSNQKYEEERFSNANINLKKTNLFVNRVMNLMMPLMMLIMNGICILIIWQGAHAIDNGLLQVGDMLAFIQYAMQIIMSFLMISMFSIMLPRANVSANRIMEILETDESIKDPEKPKEFGRRIKGLVEFKNVSFRYPDSDEDVITDVTFTAKPGTTTAFIGSTGSGKSTLINLIPRLYDVTNGEILVDGINVKDVLQKDLHDKIGYVPQKGVLFSGTIESNIKYSDESMSDEKMIEAARIAQAEEFILSKKEGYKSPISQGGTNVSGGQKQRLSIARAIAKNPEIYIFDDSFSALDFKTDFELRKALYNYAKDSTIFIVAQRINTILKADQIVVLDEGKVVGIGTHQELLKNCSVYKEIAESQLSKEELENA
ncbi:MAG TPA: ABC transporter ATP-binding protein [Candidatus Onthousia faecavium]|nr:ABC transporter ATP-binding protein [Candidatus Onthousia faecavium]